MGWSFIEHSALPRAPLMLYAILELDNVTHFDARETVASVKDHIYWDLK